MSNNMVKFLRAWLDWAESGAPGNHPAQFDNQCGLCANSNSFEEHGLGMHWEDVGGLESELGDMFGRDGLDSGYPFGMDAYDSGASNGTQHEHEPRLSWVREKLAEVEVVRT